MKKQKSAKRAFLSSFLSFVLCFTMFAGTTYAWYNDSVTSGRNKIVSGSLEMVIEKYTGENDGGFSNEDNWVTVTDQTKIFNETAGALTFEPGAVQVAYVRVKNEGDLAFKYSLAAKVYEEKEGTNQVGVTYKLSNYLKFGQAQNVTAPFATREDAISAIGTAGKISDTELVPTANLQKKTTSGVIALVIYLPSNTGNEANPLPNAKPEISFGLNALATQFTVESDSFSNTYDALSEFPGQAISNATVPATGETVITAGENTATVPAGSENAAPGDVLTLTVTPTSTDASVVINNSNNAITYDVSLVNQNGQKVSSSTGITVEMKIGQVDIQGFYHNSTALTEVDDIADLALNKYYYDPVEGVITFITDSFSPFTAEIKYSGGFGDEDYPYLISSAKDFRAIANDYEYDADWEQSLNEYCYKLTSDITIENWCMNVIYVMKGEFAHDSYSGVYFGVFDGGNHTIRFNWNDDSAMPETSAIALFGEVCNGTIKNLKVDCNIVTGLDTGVLSSYTYYGAQFDNVTVSGTIRSKSGNIGGITVAAWETKSNYHSLFKDCTVSADIYWEPCNKGAGYLYVAPFIGQLVGGTYLSFDNCVSSGTLNIPYNSTVSDIYTGTLYARNPGYADVPEANLINMEGKVGDAAFAAISNIYEGYTIHMDR
ncbi:MAG: hypothetical protein IJL83_05750 [Clostridia bacterium]|nr:hypothetical protein [Clostridia bacterium]